jgi:mRNA interferase YafQ
MPKQASTKPKLKRFVRHPDFDKDYDRARKSGKHRTALKEIWALLEILRTGTPVPEKYCHHYLKGDWLGYIDCHVAGDYVLIFNYIYVKGVETIQLVACGTHSELGL